MVLNITTFVSVPNGFGDVKNLKNRRKSNVPERDSIQFRIDSLINVLWRALKVIRLINSYLCIVFVIKY